jgi:hypothetical protein
MFPSCRRSVISLVCVAAAVALVSGVARAELALNKGDHIALIGNGVPDRMQHHGWLETLITARFRSHDLVFRNLGFSGDEIAGFLDQPAKGDAVLRNRSDNFGSNDEWLKKVQADVVLAFFGFNESFAGDAGLPKFKSDLTTFIKETRGKNYSGKGAPRLVLFGPLEDRAVPYAGLLGGGVAPGPGHSGLGYLYGGQIGVRFPVARGLSLDLGIQYARYNIEFQGESGEVDQWIFLTGIRF